MMKRMLSFMLITVLLMLMVPSVAEETVKTIELYANRIDLRQILSQDGITVLMTETQLDGSGKLTLSFAYSASDELRAANNTIYVVPEILAAVGDADPVSLTKKNDRLQVFSEGAVTYYTVDNPDLQDVNLQISVAVQDYDKRAITEDISANVTLHFLGDADKDLPVQEIHTGIPDGDGLSALPDSPVLMSFGDYSFGFKMLCFMEEGITYIPYEKGSLPEGYTLYFSDVKVNGVEWSAGLCSAYGELMYYLFPESKFPYPVESFTFSLIAYSEADGMPSYFSGPFEIIPDLAEVAQPEAQTAEENTEAEEYDDEVEPDLFDVGEWISLDTPVTDAEGRIHLPALEAGVQYRLSEPFVLYEEGDVCIALWALRTDQFETKDNDRISSVDFIVGVDPGFVEFQDDWHELYLAADNMRVNGSPKNKISGSVDSFPRGEMQDDRWLPIYTVRSNRFGFENLEDIRTIEMDSIFGYPMTVEETGYDDDLPLEEIMSRVYFRTGPITLVFGE